MRSNRLEAPSPPRSTEGSLGITVGLVVATLLCASLQSGCGYLQNRIDDLQDVARFGIEIGPQFGIHAEATSLLHTGLGFGLVPEANSIGVGFMGRHTPRKYRVQCFDLLFVHYRAIEGHPENLCTISPLFPGTASTHAPRDYHPLDWLDTEVAVYCVVGARVGFNPGQLIDFLAGLFTLDLAGDDRPLEPESPAGAEPDRPEPDAKRAPQTYGPIELTIS